MRINVKHLLDRPCSVCEFHKENGCCKWSCVFEQEPTTKNNLGVDCISREQALRELKESAKHHVNDSREEVLLRRDRDIIRALPSVTPQEPRKGHWIEVHPLQEDDGGAYMCSECKCGGLVWKPTTYCPNCGAKMESEE